MQIRWQTAAAAALLLIGLVIALPTEKAVVHQKTPPSAFSAVTDAFFDVEIGRGEIRIAGLSSAPDHRYGIERVIAEHLGDRRVVSELQPGIAMPPLWRALTLRLLYASRALDSGQIELRNDRLQIRGTSSDPDIWNDRLNFVRQIVPSTLSVDVSVIATSLPVAATDTCEEAFSSVLPPGIEFHRSSADIRSSSFAALDRIAELTARCRQWNLLITGHSDNRGDVSWNRQLSTARAQSVADYLVRSGTDAERLTVRGAGATAPLASNDSAAGRSANRRIEITLQAALL